MIREFPSILLRFFFLILLQALILDQIQVGGLFSPYVYILFILALPFETPKWMLLASSFVLGMSMDVFSHTYGLHTSACLVMAFLRPFVLERIAPRDGYEFGVKPNLQQLGLSWYLSYSTLLVFSHHFWLFNLEVYSFGEFFYTLGKVLFSGVLTILIILLFQYLTFKPARR